jgi:hypothetical protein
MRPRSAISCKCRSRFVGAVSAVALGTALKRGGTICLALYESYIHPITILSTLPSAGAGAVLALMATDTEFSIVALIGVILLIGIVKKNAIIIDRLCALDAERRLGLSPRDVALSQRGSLTGSGDCGVEGRAPRHARRSAALFGVGDHHGADATGGFPPGATPDRRADRIPSSAAWP